MINRSLGLKQRLYLYLLSISVLTLLIVSLVLMVVTKLEQAKEAERALSETAELVAQDVVFMLITDDLSRLDQRMNLYVQQQLIREVSWHQGVTELSAYGAMPLDSPLWFVELVDIDHVELKQQVVWFGKYYGDIVLVADPVEQANRIWTVLLRWLAIILGLLLIVMLTIEFLIHPAIVQVQRLTRSAIDLSDRKLDKPVDVGGFGEFYTLSEQMEQMRQSLQLLLSRSEQQQAQLTLVSRENEQRYLWLKVLLDHLTSAVILLDNRQRILFVNQLYCDYFRLKEIPEALVGMDIQTFLQGGQYLFTNFESVAYLLKNMNEQATPIFNQVLYLQDERILNLDFLPIVENNQVASYLWLIVDVTEAHHLRQALADERDLAQVTLASIGDGVITTDEIGRITLINSEASRLTGWGMEAIGQPIDLVFRAMTEAEPNVWLNPVAKVLQTGEKVELASHTLLQNQTTFRNCPIEDSVAPIFDRQGVVIGTVLVFHDVSDKYALEKELYWRASHDSLTQLMSRGEFEVMLEKRRESQDEVYSLLYLDLDQFKVVNDTAGHLAGDDLLRNVSRLLSEHVDAEDVLARLGGDEFAILLQGGESVANTIAERVRESIEQFRFVHESRIYRIGVSIGVVANIGNIADSKMIMASADAACYAAKNSGRNRVWLYRADDDYMRAQQEEMSLVADIQRALEDDSFELHAQMLVPLQEGGHGLHFEMLVRMLSTDGKIVSPAIFIPSAENYGLMGQVDRWVIRHTFKMLAENPEFLEQVDVCAINLSMQSFEQLDLVTFISNNIIEFQIPGHKICFEVTETAAVMHLSNAEDFILAMKQLGCQFALDDFGSGQSSFRYLKHLPVNYLKIDGSFVKDMLKDNTNAALVRGMHEIAKSLQMTTVAEFVENEDVAQCLRDIGVDYGQGWYFHRAEPLRHVIDKRLMANQ